MVKYKEVTTVYWDVKTNVLEDQTTTIYYHIDKVTMNSCTYSVNIQVNWFPYDGNLHIVTVTYVHSKKTFTIASELQSLMANIHKIKYTFHCLTYIFT